MSSAPKSIARFAPVDELSVTPRNLPEEDVGRTVASAPGVPRTKTRFLNFSFTEPAADAAAAEAVAAGWVRPGGESSLGTLTIVHGAGAGRVFQMDKQVIQIGRDDGQDIQLDFGDTAISRRCHASIAFYGPESGFTVRDGLKPNPVLVNGTTLNGEGPLKDGDMIRVGETTLVFRTS